MPFLVFSQKGQFSTIDSLNERAEHHYYYEKDSAYYYFDQVADIAKKIKNDSILVESLFNTTGVASYHYDLERMGGNLSQLKTLIQNQSNVDSDNLNILLYYQGDYYLKLFDYDKSKKSFNNIIKNSLNLPVNKRSATLKSLESAAYSFLGKIFMYEGKFAEAKALYEKNIRDIKSNHSDNLEALYGNYNLLAEVLLKENKYIEANSFWLKTYRYNIEKNNTNAIVTNAFNLAKNYGYQLKKDSAFFYLAQAKKYSKNNSIFNPKYYLGKAEIHKQNWEYEVALIEADSAITFINKNFKDRKNADLAIAYNEKGLIYSLLNQDQKAIINFELALKKTLENSDKDLLAIKIYNNKAAILNKLNQVDAYVKAEETTANGTKLIDKLKPNFRSAEDKLLLIEDAFPLFESGIEAVYNLYKITNNSAFIDKAFYYAEKSKSILLLEALLSSKATKFSKIPKDILERERQLKSEITFLEKQLQNSNSDQLKLNDNLFKLKQENRNLEEVLEHDFPAYFNLKYDSNVANLTSIKKGLDYNELLVSYFYGNKAIYAIAVTKNTSKILKINRDELLDNKVKLVHKMLSDPKSNKATLALYTNELYSKLLKPLIASDKISKLTLITDGLLNYLPFSALNTNPKGLTYLMQKYAISYSNSATVLKEVNTKKQLGGNLLAFAPSFDSRISSDDTRSNVLGSLPNNQKEVKQVARNFNGKSFFAEQATLQNFTTNLSDYSMLHLATHAVFDDNNPEYSYLAFTPNKDSEDLLFVKDLYNLSLNASLVTLSACESGIGELKRGEGFLSLARGFFYSGASSILSTLWKVNDNSSSELMGSFYENMADGKSKDQSLREAQQSFLEKNYDNGLSHPYYWSGFIIQGNTQPIIKATNWWLYFFCGILFTSLFLFRKRLFQLFK